LNLIVKKGIKANHNATLEELLSLNPHILWKQQQQQPQPHAGATQATHNHQHAWTIKQSKALIINAMSSPMADSQKDERLVVSTTT
jgi:hypothetical protein